MVYKSKIGWGLLAPIIILFVLLSIIMIVDEAWPGLLIILITSGFIFYMFINTYYAINDSTLNVYTGFGAIAIDIATIKAVEETNTLLSAPALSLDRIEVFYNRYDSVVISPPDKIAFIAHLKSINNGIEIKLKQKN